MKIKTEFIETINADIAKTYRIVPFDKKGKDLYVYSDQNTSQQTEELEVILGLKIHIQKYDGEALGHLLNLYYRTNENGKKLNIVSSNSNEFIEEIICKAIDIEASDVHIERFENRARVRYRIDGKLVERFTISTKDYPQVINKIKIASKLDIAEKRLPQDGRIDFNCTNSKTDIRVSVLPTLYGEKIVLRLLQKDTSKIHLNSLGFSKKQLSDFYQGIGRPNGIVLVSGPTGSGKTTTLYGALKFLNTNDRNIVTIEDPIEYSLEGINQVQVKEEIGLGFARALRTFLRQDPDVIMLGEIRDPETALMAIRAALTGHLVLSTIHTNSAWGTISRLKDMGIPPYLIASTINLSMAQRLLRKLCPLCKTKAHIHEINQRFPLPDHHEIEFHYLPKGCENCYYTGYKGRLAVFELIVFDADKASLIYREKIKNTELEKTLNYINLKTNALNLVFQGQTSLEEVYSLLG